MTQHHFGVRGAQTTLDDRPFLVKGLRCSNALLSDATADELIEQLGVFAGYGVNTVSVYLMGNRFGDVKGYREDGSLDPTYSARLSRIIEAADARAMVVLVGCLYWGDSRAKWESWTQVEANTAVYNTVAWLLQHDYRNVFVDVDNEGMARREAGFDNRQMLRAGKAADPTCIISTNYRGAAPPEADLAIHFSERAPGKPYVESEGSPRKVPDGGGYWGSYSNLRDGSYNYVHIGQYTSEMKESQVALAREHLERGEGYMLASTWLQCPPPGPYQRPGGVGSPEDPGIRWWLEWLCQEYGAYP
jgi:hypothetical protein